MCEEHLYATSATGYVLILKGLCFFQIILSHKIVLKICCLLHHLNNKKTHLHPVESGSSVVRNPTIPVRYQRLHQTCHWYLVIPQPSLQQLRKMWVCIFSESVDQTLLSFWVWNFNSYFPFHCLKEHEIGRYAKLDDFMHQPKRKCILHSGYIKQSAWQNRNRASLQIQYQIKLKCVYTLFVITCVYTQYLLF